MNKVLAAVTRPKFYIPVAILLIAIVAFLSIPRTKEKNNEISNQDYGLSKKAVSKLDKQKIEGMEDMLTRIVSFYTISDKNYPQGTKDGWANILDEVPLNSSFQDPYTETFYSFVDKDVNPDFGQVQYYPGGSCNTKSQTFKVGTYRTMALRTRLYHSYHCSSFEQIQAKEE